VYTLSLLLLLTALAGVIAYAGDILGTTVGRRRLSLFGWRPKRTGQVVGIFVGILIMLTTLGILSLAFRDAAAVLLRAQDVARELDALREEQEALSAEVARLEAEISAARAQQARLEADNETLKQDNAALTLSNEALTEENEALTAQNVAFRDTFNNLQNQVVSLENQLQELRERSEREAQNLNRTLEQLEAASGTALTYRRGEIVYSALISAESEVEILEALQTFYEEAKREAVQRGASDVTVLRPDQLAGLTQAVAASPGEDLVVFVASDNFVAPAPVRVGVEALPNHKILDKGQLVASRRIHLGAADAPTSREAVRAEVARLTQESVGRLQRLGLFEQVRPAPTESAFDGFTAWLTRMSGPVTIGTVAKAPVYVGGPAELEFVILY